MNGGTGLLGRENYPIVPLEELCDLCSGITKGRKVDSRVTVEVPYMAVANVQDGSLRLDNVKTIEATPEEIYRYRLLPGDLLLTEGGDPDKLGRGAIWNGEITSCIHQNHIFRARKASQHVDMEYLAHLVSSPYGKRYFLRQSKQTTGIASINMGQLKRFPIPLPPLEEQRRIAAILDKASDLRGMTLRLNGKLEPLLRSMFLRLFGDPITNEMGWKEGSVSELFQLINGRAFKTSEWSETGLPIIRIVNVRRPSEPYNFFNGKWDRKHLVKDGDILLCWAGQLVSIGVHRWNRGEGLLNQHIFKVVPKTNCDPDFIAFSLGMVIERAKSNFRGIEMKHLTKEDLDRERMIIPPLGMQERFGDIARSIEGLRANYQSQLLRAEGLVASIAAGSFEYSLPQQLAK